MFYSPLKMDVGCTISPDWNAQIVLKAATTFLLKHMQKLKIKCLFNTLSLTIVLNMQCHLFMYSVFELWCFEIYLHVAMAQRL